ncbi:dipeptidase [Dactylosporangium roseum]|uniref:Dipeptidase n=1 Tax=Dactylosporangium roseum TaxID=47989 RepID=A0ABY5Z0M5_9ACTN|nr:membrane dipeptidase [Dactylosporangium roseum]UWZ34633.1 dipeptidase [Dactylosporangium roseum]
MDRDNPLGLSPTDRATAKAAYDDAVVIDCSNVGIVDPWLDRPIQEQFFDKMIQGGVTVSNVTVPHSSSGAVNAVKELRAHRTWIATAADKAILCLTVDDIRRAKREGRAGIIFGPQGTDLIEDVVEMVGFVHSLGVRIMQLTYNTRNYIGDGCLEPGNAGLSLFGRDVIRAMNEYGIVVDLSHCGDRTTAEAIEASANPSIFSHANARAVYDHPRNRTDDQIRAIAEKGGVICLTPYSTFVRERTGSAAPLDALAAHLDHVVNLVGVEHVGLATDINENNETRRIWHRHEHPDLVGDARHHNYPVGFDGDLRKYGVFSELLVKLGYTSDQIGAILGGNLVRVFETAWGKR